MTKISFTSKTIIGKPVEPKLIKQMMKTNLFKSGHQAGMTLIVFSIFCWIIVAILGTSFIIKQQQISTQLDLTKEAINQLDPILYNSVFTEEASPLEGTSGVSEMKTKEETEVSTLEEEIQPE